jgi:hypothetical protein
MSENDQLAQKGIDIVAGKAEDIITAIPSIQDKALLKAALDAETAGKNRTTVVQALNEAIGPDANAGGDNVGAKAPNATGDKLSFDPNAQRGDGGDADREPIDLSNHVKMVRDEPQFEGGPVEANVHPDEVGNYSAGGWQKA